MVTLLSRLGLGSIGISMALAPMSGFAYLTPEQVFGDSGDTFDQTDPSTRQAPPLQREGAAVIQEQQRRSAEQRAAAQSTLRPEDAEPEDTEPPTTIEKELQEPRGLFDDDTQYQLRLERKAASETGSPTIVIRTDGTVVDASGNTLHSGAPKMSGTGPESVLAFAALIFAAFTTIISAQMRSRALTPA